MQKINAYTLMEVTVAMLLSAITISICYTAYGITTNYFRSFEAKNKLANEVLTLRHTLDRDAQNSKYILKTTQGVDFLKDSTNITYVFTDAYVLRKLNELHTDTFKLETKELVSFFESREVIESDTVDQINFKLFLAKDIAVTIQTNKYYSAQDLFH